MGASQNYNVNLNISANAQSAQLQLQTLLKLLLQISNMKINIGTGAMVADIQKASDAAILLSAHLKTATNMLTGNLDFSKFYKSILQSGASLELYGAALLKMGPAGLKAFVGLADTISKAEIPLKRTNKLVDGMWDGLKRTAGWLLQSSIIHGVIGGVQKAVGYAKDLNKSLIDIRIVTGQSTEQMAQFAKEANKAAKKLSTTTTDYTKASLIYYQLGLSDAEVKARTEATIKMANATGQSAQTVSNLMTAVWNNFDNGTKSLTHYADVMTALGAATASSTDEIAQGLQKFAAVSDTVGLSYEYAASALATVTATTRESADVVGNSFKTLFSRILGLQLGETLEDGTTLNKYSRALLSVGIAIKDQSGEMKNMDLILDEMGNKWSTLARDEQMALAQTVAGVRQYTLLMALMENWDYFKENLGVAKTSTGTLDLQLAIYAEGWEAATNRVRTAWESLWDNLINSEGMITLLDWTSGLVGILDKIVQGFDGAAGMLASFGAIALKVFSPKLSAGIADVAYGIGMAFGGKARMQKELQQFMEKAENVVLSQDYQYGALYGPAESEARKSILQQLFINTERYLKNKSHMSALLQLIEEMYQLRDLSLGEELIQTARAYDKAKEHTANAYWDLYDALGGNRFGDRIKKLLTTTELNELKIAEGNIKHYLEKQRKLTAEFDKGLIKEDAYKQKTAENLNRISQNQLTIANIKGDTYGSQFRNNIKAIAEFLSVLSNTKNTTESLDAFSASWSKLSKTVQDSKVGKALKLSIDNGDIDAAVAGASGIAAQMTDVMAEQYAAELGMDKEAVKKYASSLLEEELYNLLRLKLTGLKPPTEAERLRNLEKQAAATWSDSIIAGGLALLAMTSAMLSMQALTAGEGSIAAIGSLALNAGLAFSGFNKMLGAFPKAISLHSTAISLGLMAMITTMDLVGKAIDKKNNKLKNEAIAAESSAKALESAYTTNKSNHLTLLTAIETYKQSEKQLLDITLSSKERAELELEHNRATELMISQYGLTEDEYTRIGNQLLITQAGLDRITEQSETIMNQSRAASDAAKIESRNAANRANEETAEHSLKNSLNGYDKKKTGEEIIKWGLGIAAGAVITAAAIVAAPAVLAALGIGAGVTAATVGTAAGVGLIGSGLGLVTAGVGKGMVDSHEADGPAEMAIEKVKKEGTAWMDSIESIQEELNVSSKDAALIFLHRDSLETLKENLDATAKSSELVNENTARNLVASHKIAKNFEENAKISDGATEVYTKAYTDLKNTLTKIFDGKDFVLKTLAGDTVKEVFGLDSLTNFAWDKDDRDNRRMSYTYTDENGNLLTGAIGYDAIIAAQSSKSGSAAVSAYTDQMIDVYNGLKSATGDKDVAGGLFSLITGGDFDTATKQEIDKTKTYLSAFNGDVNKMLEHFGMDGTAFAEKYGISADAFLQYYSNYQSMSDKLLSKYWNNNNTGSFLNWANENAFILNSMSEKTARTMYSNLEKISAIGGAGAAETFLNGLTDMLKDTGVSDVGKAMELLMAIDWTSYDATSDAAAIISSLGGELDTASAAWQNYANSMRAAMSAMPDFSALIGLLTLLLGILNSINLGDTLDSAFVEEMLAKYPEFKDIIMKTWDGNYKLTGDSESVEKYSELMQQEVSKTVEDMQAQQEIAEQYFGKDGSLHGKNASITVENLANIASLNKFGSSYNYTDELRFAEAAGYSPREIENAQTSLNTKAALLNLWNNSNLGTTGRGNIIEGKQIVYDKENDWFVDQYGNILEGTDDLAAREAYEADVANYLTAKGIVNSMDTHLLDIINADYDLMTEEGKELFASTFNSTNKVMEAVMAGNKMMVEDGIISDAAMLQLQILPETSTRTTEAIDQLAIAKENLENATPEETEEALRIYDLALAYTELLTAIDAAAAARGLDADMLAQLTAALLQTGEYSDYTTDSLISVAAEMLEHKLAIDELNSGYSDLASKIRSSEKDTNEWMQSMVKMKKLLAGVLNIKDWNQLSDAFILAAESSGLLAKAAEGDADAISDLAEYSLLAGEAIENGLIEESDLATKGFAALDEKVAELAGKTDLTGPELAFLDFANNVNTALDGIKALNVGEIIPDGELHNAVGSALQAMDGFSGGLEGLANAASQFGLTPILEAVDVNNEAAVAALEGQLVATLTGENSFEVTSNFNPADFSASSGATLYKIRYAKTGGGGSAPSGGGGGGGGGPKKVANKRKSQTVKRYKKTDFKRDNAQSAKKSVEKSRDYLYGEAKIALMEKINKLAEKEAHITSDRIKESLRYLKEDRENLIKVMQKWGYDATFDEDGFLTSYEEAWTKVHEKIAKLYEDNELTADEQKLEEDYKVELEELEGALEDYENSLKELQADIEAYEESLYEMYDNKVELMQHKVEFKIELNEDDLSYLDFWIEALGDSLYNALESLQTMGLKTNILFDGINTYKEGIEEIYALSDDPLHTWATGGLDDVLTQDQVDALRENRDGLMDYMLLLLELRETMQDKVLEVFDKWQEKLNNTMSTIEHYSSVLEHFKNIMDIVGKESLGLTTEFMANFRLSSINQSMDTIDATKAHYDSLVTQNAEAQANLEAAIASGDQSRIEHWEGVVQSTTEAMQEAQDSLLSSLESTLTMIAEQFESAMTEAVEAFNDAIYAHGGLLGLSDDYSLIREQADLMAEDYDKIYQLSKLNRNINKVMNDSSVIAGKQKMKSLQQEINELQASGVELSKYDLEYLQAKYELRLAELELENAKNNKDTVRLSKDSEGNWSYVYTASVDKVDEAQLKYEDALYAMLNLSYEYMEEMSSQMMNTSLAMMEEIQALRIQDFNSYEEYAAEVQRIQDKYQGFLLNQENELNKSVANNQELYNKDWLSYSAATGYKISAALEWADNYSETTLGTLLGSESSMSDFANTIFNLSTVLTGDLGAAAINYFANVETAMNKYGTSISGFGSTVTSTVDNISTKSLKAATDMKIMALEMNAAFKEISDSVVAWQEEFSGQINTMLEEIGQLIQNINDAISRSANLTGDNRSSSSLIGTSEALDLLNENGKWGEWSLNKDGSISIKGFNRDIDGDDIADKNVDVASIVEINSALITEIDKMMRVYFNTDSLSDLRKTLGEQLKLMFKDYHEFRNIVSRIYDITDLASPTYAEPTSLDTGGYTGEWGSSGKLAMLHEKELVLNASDTENFLDALNVSKEVINRMIEMNAMQSSLGFGNLHPAALRDFAQNLEQQVSITAEFPNAKDHNEIEEAFSNLINQASQYANRYI